MQMLFIRHGITDWNQQSKIQGWTDIPLNDAGRSQLATSVLPQPWRDARCYTSTLVRTIETAQILTARNIHSVPELREMHWGHWEGRTLLELRQSDPDAFDENERKGLDFRPLGGESPREVRSRLNAWLAGLAMDVERVVVITHKGVIRAALSLADNWDMQHQYSAKIDWLCGHEFAYSRTGGLLIERLNVSLQKPVESSG